MDPVVPMERWPRRRGRTSRYIAVSRIVGAAVLIAVLLLATVGVDLFTDWLWFESVGFESVYVTAIGAQVALFFVASVLFMLVYFPSTFLARRLAYRFEHLSPPQEEDGIWAYIARVGARVGEQNSYRRLVNSGIVILGLFLAVIMGLVASGQWALAMRYRFQVPFGLIDPVFGQDVGFYVFSLPFLRALHSWTLGTLILVTTTTVAVYAVVTAYELGINLERVAFNLPRAVKLQIAILVAALMLVVAANHLLDLFELVYSTRGAAYGPGYTDVRAEMPALYIMFGTAILASSLILVSAFSRSLRPAITGLGLWAIVALVGGLIFPNLVEAFEVKPNQLEKERPYLENSIAFTRKAFGLDAIQEQFFPADDQVSLDDVRFNPETLQNIRLWDHRPLRDTYNQIQSIRSYYTFEDVDVDRYHLKDGYRQVMVAPRELAPENLQAQARTWVNQRLKFTHGYGVAMSLVAEVAEEGRPLLVIQDVPPRGDIPITRPEIYYGARSSSYVLVNTTEAEFDYPRGDDNVEARHQGNSGVNVGTFLRRVSYAIRFRDANILLSSAIRPESEVLYRRAIRERVERIAPFLLQDRDPYIVVADGQLYWIMDAYTTSNAFPYSQPVLWRRTLLLNYIRNSVKIVMNAYDGSMRFYVSDPEDPLIQAYQQIFPDLFAPLSEMPASLRQHVRYPEDLFRIQSERYQAYHMQDPSVFYNREDMWAIPFEKFYADRQPVDPYYVIMRLPGVAREEFLIMQPFTPLNKDNMIAWLAARSDEPNYGKLLVYKFPKEKLVYGPYQVEGRIDQDPAISAQFTLWSQAGSRVIRGNMLVIPVGTSNLFVEPIYLQAENGPIPELKRVVVANGNRLVMENTLDEALLKLFGARLTAAQPEPTQPRPATETTGFSPAVAELIRSAGDHFTKAQEALRTGDWARYGQEQKALEADLKRLAELTGQ